MNWAERFSEALIDAKPADVLRKAFLYRIHERTQIPLGTLENYWDGQNEPPIGNYFAICDAVPGLKARTEGQGADPTTPADRIEIIRAELRELERELPARAIPIRGKVS